MFLRISCHFTIFNFSLFNNKVIDEFTEKKCSHNRLILQKNDKRKERKSFIVFNIKKYIYLCTGIKFKKQRRVYFNL